MRRAGTKSLAIGALVATFGPNLCGQKNAALPHFDVATVKAVNEPDPGGYRHQITPQGITMRAVSMGYCVRLAYGLSAQRPWQLAGPAWIDPPTEFLYDIIAKTDKSTSEDQLKVMLQALLADRFKLVSHRDRRKLPAYALSLTKNPPLLQSSEPNRTRRIVPGPKPYQLTFEHVSMSDLAQQLGPPMTPRPVFDATGLTGSFNFTLDLGRYILDPATGTPTLDASGMIDSEGATLRAVREQLGLMLRPDQGEFEVLVIDHVEKRPTAN
jgi:uncharacterized protein (TIGR03435 family)